MNVPMRLMIPPDSITPSAPTMTKSIDSIMKPIAESSISVVSMFDFRSSLHITSPSPSTELVTYTWKFLLFAEAKRSVSRTTRDRACVKIRCLGWNAIQLIGNVALNWINSFYLRILRWWKAKRALQWHDDFLRVFWEKSGLCWAWQAWFHSSFSPPASELSEWWSTQIVQLKYRKCMIILSFFEERETYCRFYSYMRTQSMLLVVPSSSEFEQLIWFYWSTLLLL